MAAQVNVKSNSLGAPEKNVYVKAVTDNHLVEN